MKEGLSDIDLTIRIGGEDTSIFEIMQRFRNDGSCEHTIQQALVAAALAEMEEPVRHGCNCYWCQGKEYGG